MTSKSDQQKRFEQAAREAGCDDSEKRFERAIKEIAKAPPQHIEKPKKKNR